MQSIRTRNTRRVGLAVAGAALAAPVLAVDLGALEDESYVSLTGTVVTSGEDQFALDYGEDIITVEMDDYGPLNDAAFIDPGDRVTVDGRVDNAFYEAKTIEASRVFSYDRSTYYYASSADEEGDLFSHEALDSAPAPVNYPDGSWVSMSGTVTKVDGREFMLSVGGENIAVDTITMAYNPLDNVGYQQLDVGDRLTVVGEIDDDLFDRLELEAERIYSVVGS